MADNTASLIRAFQLRRADVLGWSMGGMIAQSLARRHPRRVRRLVLCATAPGNRKATFPEPDVLALLANPAASPLGVFSHLFPDRPAAGPAYVQDIGSYRDSAPLAAPEVTQAQFGAAGLWLSGGEPSGRPLRRLKLPVLVGAGGADRILPADNSRHLAARLPNARLVVYPRAGHGFLFAHRRDWVRRVKRFLN
jgi:pimeloyl-ACP methyl ester carboxylesterase